MAETPPTSRNAYTEGMKWALALAIAAVAGAFVHLSDLAKLPFGLRILAALASVGFLIAVFCGVQYLIRLYTDDVRRQELADIEAKADDATDQEKARALKLSGKLADSDKDRPRLYRSQTIASSIAAGIALLFLPAAILTYKEDPKKPDVACVSTPCCAHPEAPMPSADRFAIVYSADHPGRSGRMQHTFLLDKQTGTLWQMICQKNGIVAFQETPRIKAP